jgi:hypothetical protein
MLDNIQKAMMQYFRQQPMEYFANRMCQLQHQWDYFLNGHGKFFLTAAIPSLVTVLEWV